MRLQDLVDEIKKRSEVDYSPRYISLLKWVEENKGDRTKYQADYYIKHKDRIRKRQKAYSPK